MGAGRSFSSAAAGPICPWRSWRPRVAEWGYQGLELLLGAINFEVQRAASEDDYCPAKLDLLNRLELSVPVVSAHRVSHAVCDPIDARLRAFCPTTSGATAVPRRASARRRGDDGDGPRRAEARRAVLPASPARRSGPASSLSRAAPDHVAAALKDFARRGIRSSTSAPSAAFATPSRCIRARSLRPLQRRDGPRRLTRREEFGFTFDASHFHWQGLDPVEFVRRFPRSSVSRSHQGRLGRVERPLGLLKLVSAVCDPRRGWTFVRRPRGIDWESVIRALNEAAMMAPCRWSGRTLACSATTARPMRTSS